MIPPEKIIRLFIPLRVQIVMERGETMTHDQQAEILETSVPAITHLMSA